MSHSLGDEDLLHLMNRFDGGVFVRTAWGITYWYRFLAFGTYAWKGL